MQSPSLFGSPLVTALARSSFTTPSGLSIPGILARCFHEIEEKGLDIEGIFRKSGSAAAVNQLQAQFEENHNPFLVKIPSTMSTHSLAALFKRYLQQLPEPVIPRSYQSLFIDIFDEEKCSKETLKRRLKEICKTLPHEHLHLLQFLFEVAHSIQQHQDKNQMSIESLAIIFAPTCVRIDGVSQLLPDSKQNRSSSYSFNNGRSCSTSYTSLPVVLNKQQLFRRARELLLGAVVRKKQQQQGNRQKLAYGNTSASTLLYKPNELLQLDLVKESNTWIRIFEFMMTFPEVFTTLTNPLKSQKYVRPVLSANTSAPAAPATTAATQADIKKTPFSVPHSPPTIKSHKIDPSSLWTSPFTQQEKKMLIDFSTLEFSESHDLIKTFEHFELKTDHHVKDKDHQQSQPLLLSSSSATKYVKTLQSWKTREEENPTIVIPQEVIIGNKRKTTNRNTSRSSSPSFMTNNSRDWIKFSATAIEPNEKNSARQPIFLQQQQ
ncbi:hypothetical protein HMPREF1544_00835 [Mucor circinelloides 1006PhL]|uniref:Rho-GAP domain-containing protein n=1 Tax=Mucor circinelloides f. circinelloides (strain 1006PhL) TaxID=1220926 RepID=S2JPJ9_MUCC1|nr:hypothetical protein HMPREF1544_00835 [Mucor circinelloides 1006PhL]